LSDTILAPIDRQAEALIRGAIAQTVIFTAINPVAFIEGLFFVGRGLRLVRQIAELYGGRPGFIGSVHLMRRLIVGSGAVGAADIVGNVLTQKLGGILNKVTLGVAEDVAESVYAAQKVATFGIASMRLCRPIPFTPGAVPSVSGLVAHAIQK
jgi:putative membrane protein